MYNTLRERWRPIAAALALFLAAFGGTVLIIDTDGPGPEPARTVTIPRSVPQVTATVDSADPGRAPDTIITAPAPVVAAGRNTLEQDLHAEDPSDANVQAQDEAAHNDQLPIVSADAAPSQRGCLSRFVGNYSSRRGVAPRLLELHETVSPDRPGWSDVNAIGAQFNSPSSQASSTYALDREAHCLYLVRESDKPWTQAAANPWSISFEIVNMADRRYARNLIDGPGRRLLLRILNDASKRWNIPLRLAQTRGCVPVRSGISDHAELGPCGGGHVDTSPWRGGARPGQIPAGAVRAIVVDARRLCVRRYRSAHHPVPARCKA